MRQSKLVLKEFRDQREVLEKELETFWSNDENRLRERYERTLGLLEELDREDWSVRVCGHMKRLSQSPSTIDLALPSKCWLCMIQSLLAVKVRSVDDLTNDGPAHSCTAWLVGSGTSYGPCQPRRRRLRWLSSRASLSLV